MVQGRISFGDFTKQQSDAFFEELGNLESKVRALYVATGVEDAGEIFDSSINMGEIIRSLPKNQRDSIMNEYSELLGLKHYINTRGDAISSHTTSNGKKLSRFDVDLRPGPDGKLNPMAVVFNRMNMGEHYLTGEPTASSNILRPGFVKQISENISIEAGKNVLVFDTETASLGLGNLREIAAYSVKTGMDNGRLTVSSPTKKTFHRHLKTTPMRLGSLFNRDTGALETMEQVLQKQVGYNFVEGAPGDGDVFAKTIQDFIGQIMDSDHIVGQNIQFDIGQVFQGVKKTSMYKNDPAFKAMVIKAENHMQGKIIDTLELARIKVPDLTVAKELQFGGAASSHSLENMLLQTNLADEIMKDMGEDAFLTKIGARSGSGTVHAADVDTMIESYLFKFLSEDKLRQLDPEKGEKVNDLVRTSVFRSYAPTPVSNIADIGHLHPEVTRRLYDMNMIDVMDEETGKSVKAQAKFGSYEDTMAGLSGEVAPPAKYGVTPIEQDAFVQRDLGIKVGTVEKSQIPVRGNTFAEFAGADIKGKGFLNATGELSQKGSLPTVGEYREFQRTAAASGDLLAGLSLPERILTEGMQRATQQDSEVQAIISGAEQATAKLTGDLGVSRFQLYEDAYIGRSGTITLPSSVLGEVESINMGANISRNRPMEMARVSAYRQASGKYRANLGVELGAKQKADLISHISSMNEEDFMKIAGSKGLSQEAVVNALDELEAVNGKYVIDFGQVSGKAAEGVHNVLSVFSNSKQMRSDASEMTFRAAILDTSDGVGRVGAFISDKLMDDADKSRYMGVMRDVYSRLNVVRDMGEADGLVNASMVNDIRVNMGRIGRSMGGQGGADLSKVALAAAEGVHAATKRLPLIGGILAGALTAKVGYDSYKERKTLNETFAFQGYGEQEDYYNLQQQVETQSGASRYIDPLSTAGIVSNLHGNAQRHGMMGPNRNDALFAGVI